MLRRSAGIVALLALTPGWTSAQPPKDLEPGGGPPQIGVVEAIKDGQLGFRLASYVQETRTRVVEKVPEPYTVTVARHHRESYPMDRVRAYDTEGRPIPVERY